MSTSLPIVVVTEPEFRRAEAVFTSAPGMTCVVAPPDEDAFADAIRRHGARHAVMGPFTYKGALYSALPSGGVLARYGVGHDGIDKVLATRAGLFCTNTPGVLHQSVAELTMLMILAAARHMTQTGGGVHDGVWAPRPGLEVRGRTLVIVGCGTIGRATARIARAGFGMRIVGCCRSGSRGDDDFDQVTPDYAAAVKSADFVSLHIPATAANVRFMNRERLSLLGPHTWLINTARGAVVDEAALYEALAAEQIGGAALDVYEREPYEPAAPDHDLRTLPRAILMPHVGSNTIEANIRMAERALQNISLAERGEFPAMDLLNPEVLGDR
jgi:phosphoglycerate dehydrogenase-like enzyme